MLDAVSTVGVDLGPATGYNLALGALAALAAAAVLRERGADRYLATTLAGLLLFVVGGSVAAVTVPELVHWLHGAGAVLVVAGIYVPATADLRGDPSAEPLAGTARARRSAEWMTPMDDEILDLLRGSDLVLTPAVVALNLGRSRAEVNRRLAKLEGGGLVERVERGKYRIAADGAAYLDGRLRPPASVP
ncbi:helix-turn-helix domain-containing protein [Salinilacihabitans rarus]|uniref:helix-turn-helix domain-containing protein n=1 Tax=Salinilacihabitans rarus TaxID=2961596 RepID=UPI0020C8350E|nr:helix-turn-helix domain-containing protein [Salinilacihabitans rarus]